MVWRRELVESRCPGLALGHTAGAMREARGIARQARGADSQCEHTGISAERALLRSLLTARVTIGCQTRHSAECVGHQLQLAQLWSRGARNGPRQPVF